MTTTEVPPALEAVLLHQMHQYTGWDLDPVLYLVYADHLTELPWPPGMPVDDPGLALQRAAIALEDPAVRRIAASDPAQQARILGVAFMCESWTIEEHDEQPPHTGYLGDHPDAVEARMMIAYLHDIGPVAAMHQRDSKGNGRPLRHPVPAITDYEVGPGNRDPYLLDLLQRITRALRPN